MPPGAVAGREHEAGSRPLTLLQGALFQLVNPKLWTMVAGAVAAYGSAAGEVSATAIALTFGAIFAVATFVCTAAWTLIGVQVGRLLRTKRALRWFNWSMAALLVASLMPLMG